MRYFAFEQNTVCLTYSEAVLSQSLKPGNHCFVLEPLKETSD